MPTIRLPFPPSVNRYWRHVMIHGQPRTLLSADGRAYKVDVQARLLEEWGLFSPAMCRIRVSIDLWPPCGRRRDVDYYVKGLLDALTQAKVWGDDSQIDELRVVRRGVDPPGYCDVTIEPIENRQKTLSL